MVKMEFYNLTEKEILKEFGSSRAGLSDSEALLRLEKYGKNEIKKAKGVSKLKIFLSQFNSIVVYILIAALIISAIIQEYLDSVVIGSILVINGILGFFQEYKAEKAVEALRRLATSKAMVLRNGKKRGIDASLLVPGDIILLEVGDKVPADARILDENELKTHEAILTGESTPVVKSAEILKGKIGVADQKNTLFSGTSIVSGKCTCLVIGTAMSTEIGKIASKISEIEDEETPLQKRVKKLGKILGIGVILIVLVIFLVGYFRGIDIIDILKVSASLAVAAIPEGLVVVMTISLSLGAQRMVKKNVLIRKLSSVETLGSTNVICADKTGTLTRNEMTVRRLYVLDKVIEVTGRGFEREGLFMEGEKQVKAKELELLLRIGALNNNASVSYEDTIKTFGDPTEIALLVSAGKASLKKENLEKEFPRIAEIMFTSERKIMSTIHVEQDKSIMYTKGATEIILERCNKIYDGRRVRSFLNGDKEKILKINSDFGKSALRVLAFAYKELKIDVGDIKIRRKKVTEVEENDLIFVGLQGMIDPPRKEVKEAVQKCKDAGIKVVMITGDHVETAKAIAEELEFEGEALSGSELESMNVKALEERVEEIAVFARVNPEHKLKIVEALQKKGYVVAVTGDGVNDALALKKADIGVAMGIKGTDVAKEASDMILLDDNFASIVNAVEEGRRIYDNMKKFTNYLLSCNFGEVLIMFVALVIGFKVAGELAIPLLATHLLWINLVTDGLPATALGNDDKAEGIMKRPPRKKREDIITRNMLANIIIVGSLLTLVVLYLFTRGLNESLLKAQTLAFTALVMFELVRVYVIRKQYKIKTLNKFLIFALASSIILQLLVVYTPLNVYFKTTPLSLIDWLYISIVGIIFLVLSLIAIYYIRKFTRQED